MYKRQVYSLTAGDEPGSIIEVYRFAKALGFTVVAAGKGKNNPLDIYAHPGLPEWQEKASKREMATRMLIEFVDGSKTMIEMCAVSNATGLVPDCRGTVSYTHLQNTSTVSAGSAVEGEDGPFAPYAETVTMDFGVDMDVNSGEATKLAEAGEPYDDNRWIQLFKEKLNVQTNYELVATGEQYNHCLLYTSKCV